MDLPYVMIFPCDAESCYEFHTHVKMPMRLTGRVDEAAPGSLEPLPRLWVEITFPNGDKHEGWTHSVCGKYGIVIEGMGYYGPHVNELFQAKGEPASAVAG